MSGLLPFAAIAVPIFAALGWVVRFDRSIMMFVAAALCLACAGYGWQRAPEQAGNPPETLSGPFEDPGLFAIERQHFLTREGETARLLATTDQLQRNGRFAQAAQLLGDAVGEHPKEIGLRLGYAHALMMLARGDMTPAVALAFEQSASIDPQDPAPAYFLGLAHIEAGDGTGAERIWRGLYASLPETSPWREPLAARLGAFQAIASDRREPDSARRSDRSQPRR